LPRAECCPSGAVAVLGRSVSDDVLFEGLRRGSEDHFNAFYERYFPRVYRFIASRVHNAADAEELTQETFTVVFRQARDYSGRSSPLAWVYGIARNTANNHLRRARLQSDKIDGLGAGRVHATEGAWAHNPEEELALRRCLDSWNDCLRDVTPWQLEAFRLRHVEALGIDEIAERTARSNDAVRSSLYRVKRMLVEASGVQLGGAS
jgi:RNA polymerase sigma factor (sigma-70 family)